MNAAPGLLRFVESLGLAPGAVIWLLANIPFGEVSLDRAIADWLNPFGLLLGLDLVGWA